MDGFLDHVNGDGSFKDTFGPSMISALGEGYADSKGLTDITNITGLAKAAIDSRRKITDLSEQLKTARVAPGENASDEEKQQYRNWLNEQTGVTGKVEDYLVGKPEDYPEGMHWDDANMTRLAELAVKHNIPAEAAKAFINGMIVDSVASQKQILDAQKDAFNKSVAELKGKHTTAELVELGRLAYRYIDLYCADDWKEKAKGMYEMPDNFEEWNKRGVPPQQVMHMARVAKASQAGTDHGTPGGSDSEGAAGKTFVDAVNAKSPGMQQK